MLKISGWTGCPGLF